MKFVMPNVLVSWAPKQGDFHMFSLEEKKKIAAAIENVLLEIDHPEMPKEKPEFKLHVDGKESWSWADIVPNWKFGEENKPTTSHWNENARGYICN